MLSNMAKTYVGSRLRQLRRERDLSQASLAATLGLSASYVNQIEHDVRPLTLPVLNRITEAFGVDATFFSRDDDSRLLAEVQDVVLDRELCPSPIPLHELNDMVQHHPEIARAMVDMHRRYRNIRDKLSVASEGKPLTADEQQIYSRFVERFDALCKKAFEMDVRILVDAEEYCYQAEIDRLTEEAMRKYNQKRAIVFATLQMYRHDRMPYLKYLYEDATKHNYIAGVKFVRGAYMERERARAKRMGYLDPICPNKQATDDNYDSALRYSIDNIDRFEVFNGTHNEKSNLLLASLLQQKGIAKDDQRVFFAQLYGMSDNISYNLSNAGYNVAKYVPYAPVKDVLPYLIRRAEENTAIAGQTSRELELINTEVKRRKNVE